VSLIAFLLILAQLLIVSWIDIRTKKISNLWVPANIAIALIFYFLFPSSFPFSWQLFYFPLGFIVGGFLLFLVGIMGAGDSKYLAGFFLLVPVDLHFIFFTKLIIATMVVGAVLLANSIIKNFSQIRSFLWAQYWQGLRNIIKSNFSYAPVILLAWLILGVQIWL